MRATVTGIYPGLKLPRVPGHEVLAASKPWATECPNGKSVKRVGVGLIAAEDGVCEPCNAGTS